MLQRVESATLLHDAHALTGRGWLVFVLSGRALFVGSKKVHRNEYDELLREQSAVPVYVVSVNGWHFWMFDGRFYSSTDWLQPAEVYAYLAAGDVHEHRKSA